MAFYAGHNLFYFYDFAKSDLKVVSGLGNENGVSRLPCISIRPASGAAFASGDVYLFVDRFAAVLPHSGPRLFLFTIKPSEKYGGNSGPSKSHGWNRKDNKRCDCH